jgi:N-acetylglutamate synthase-like GNAT family acetyltransferase
LSEAHAAAPDPAAQPEAVPAAAADLEAIRTLLEGAGLPTSDLLSSPPEFIVIRERGEIIAAGALQKFGSAALLRSVRPRPRAWPRI